MIILIEWLFNIIHFAGYARSSDSSGFLGSLSDKQIKHLAALQAYVKQERIDLVNLCKYSLHDDLTLLRYLRANKFDPDKALKAIHESLKFQDEHNMDEIRESIPDDILKCDVDKLHKIYPHWHCSFDLKGRPVIYQQYGVFDTAAILAETDFVGITRYSMWEKEAHMHLCKKSSLKRGEIIETTTTVLDLKDMTLSQVTGDFLKVIKMVADIGKSQYPETLGKLFIINTPSAFPYVWRIVRGFLDPAVAGKVELLSARDNWLPVLQETIGIDNLPENYGGHLAPLTTDRHPYLEVMHDFGWDEDYQGFYDFTRSDILAEYNERDEAIDHSEGSPPITPRRNRSMNSFFEADKDLGVELVIQPPRTSRFPSIAETDDGSDDSIDFSDAYDSVEDASAHGRIHSGRSDTHSQRSSSQKSNSLRSANWQQSSDHMSISMNAEQDLEDIVGKHILNSRFDFSGIFWWRSFSSESILYYLLIAMAVYFVANLGAIISAGLLLQSINWLEVIDLQMWTIILLLFVSILVVALTVAGLFGIKHQNQEMTSMIGSCYNIFGVIFLIIGISTSYYATNYSSSVQYILAFYAVFTMVLAFASYVPSSLAFSLAHRMESSEVKVHSMQNSWIIQTLSYMSIIIAIAMLIFGGHSLELVNKEDNDYYFFPLYGLIYGGMFIILVSLQGIWVSSTVHRSVVSFHYCVMTPMLIIVLFVAAVVSLVTSSSVVQDDSTTESNVTCLFAGILLLLTCGFQILNYFVIRRRNELMLQIRETERVSGEGVYFGLGLLGEANVKEGGSLGAGFHGKTHIAITRSTMERFQMFYSIFLGVFDIFFCMTYLIFEMTYAHRNTWLSYFYNVIGRGDNRYLENNSVLVAVNIMHLCVIGPGLLAFAWSTFVRATWRHVLGEMISVILIFTQLMYIFVELHEGAYDYNYSGEIALVLIPQTIFNILIPVVILWREATASINATNRAESVDLLVEAKDYLLKNMSKDAVPTSKSNFPRQIRLSTHNLGHSPGPEVPAAIYDDVKRAQERKQSASKSVDGGLASTASDTDTPTLRAVMSTSNKQRGTPSPLSTMSIARDSTKPISISNAKHCRSLSRIRTHSEHTDHSDILQYMSRDHADRSGIVQYTTPQAKERDQEAARKSSLGGNAAKTQGTASDIRNLDSVEDATRFLKLLAQFECSDKMQI